MGRFPYHCRAILNGVVGMEQYDNTSRGSIPAPWQLTGRGCILAMRFSQKYLREGTGLPAPLCASLRSGIAWVMFVDYASADCGPYRELLFIPGSCQFSTGRFLTISKIYVSTESSVVNGRANWGIPKERCDFEVSRSDGGETVRLHGKDRPIAELSFRAFGPRLPMILGLLPRRWLTLGQHLGTREFTYSPEAKGCFRFARIHRAWSSDPAFPDLGKGRILGCFAVPKFQMTFPPASVREIPISVQP